jgi:gluconolactonase
MSNAAAGENRVLAEGLRFPEGPALGPDGAVYVVEIGAARITRIDSSGHCELFADVGGAPNGSAFGPDGFLYVCNNGGRWPAAPSTNGIASSPENHGAGSIQKVGPDGDVTTLFSEVAGKPLAQPNDLCFDPQGGLWFTEPIWPEDPADFLEKVSPGAVCYLPPFGGEPVRVTRDVAYPNGIGVAPDGRTLVVACSVTGWLIGFSIEGPGRLGEPRRIAFLGREAVPDGFCFDAAGRILCAGALTSAFHVFPPEGGDREATIEVDGETPTNICFGGPEFRTVFMTESGTGRLVTRDWHTRGFVLFPDQRRLALRG